MPIAANGKQRLIIRSAHADLHHVVRCIKHPKENIRENLEQHQANGHDRKCVQHTAFERLKQTLFVARAKVISHNGHGAAV